MSIPALSDRAAAELSAEFTGILLSPGEPGYNEARRVHNGLIDKRPGLIAQCRTSADVAAVLRHARASGQELTVKGGGHNVAGRATIEGGVMIDLSLMKRIDVDVEARTARAEGGVLWGELDRATQAHGLATVGGEVSTTGIAGLTLGGGAGWLSGKYGMTVDNLLEVELVTAGGELLRASAHENPDIFWAVRGGGGNFGVATSFTYSLHPVGPIVTGGVVAWVLSDAPAVLRFFRDFVRDMPDELRVHAGMLHAPDGSGTKLVALLACHCGELADGDAAVRPLKEFGSPVMVQLGPIDYCALNSMTDAALPKGAFNYWKSSMLPELDDTAIETLVRAFEQCPAPQSFVLIEDVYGAMTRVPADATAFPHRAEGLQLLLLTQWLDGSLTDRAVTWTRETYEALRPSLAAERYVNYLDRDDEAGAAAFGGNHARLARIKAKYDPANVFRHNQNILPAQ